MANESSSLDFDAGFFNRHATLSNLLSKGAFGTVYGPIRWKDKQLAIKQVMFPGGKNAHEIKKDIEDKQQIWNSLKHKNLMRILSVDLSQLPKVLHIVMEFAAGGSLNVTLKALGSKHMKLPIDVVTDWTKQIAEGMLYLHQKNIVHRDLKPSNILLMEPFDVHYPGKNTTLKIADFDEVREYDHTTTMTFVGTCAYMAPEVLLKERFSKASDVWSFAVLIWEMLSGDIPYEGLQASAIISMAIKGELDGLSIVPSFPENYKLILEKCWKAAYEERFSFQQILEVLDSLDRSTAGPSEERVVPLRNLQTEQISTDVVKTLQFSSYVQAMAKLDDKIYVLCSDRSHGVITLSIFDDREPFKNYNIETKKIKSCGRIASSEKFRCLYIRDYFSQCFWKLMPDDLQLFKWLSNLNNVITFSTSNDGLLMILRDFTSIKKLETYNSDATINRSILLSSDILRPVHIVQEASGKVIIIHKQYYSCEEPWVISQFSNDGRQLFHQRKPIESPHEPYYLCLDSENDRLFVAQKDKLKQSVVIFDIVSMEWKETLLTFQDRRNHAMLHYDARKKQLLVGKSQEIVLYQLH